MIVSQICFKRIIFIQNGFLYQIIKSSCFLFNFFFYKF